MLPNRIRHVLVFSCALALLACPRGGDGSGGTGGGGTAGGGTGGGQVGGGRADGGLVDGGLSDGGFSDGGALDAGRDGPLDAGPVLPGHSVGDADAGRGVFRFETFGTEGFWSDAARVVEGVTQAQLTPRQALELGLSVNVDALPPSVAAAVSAELADAGTAGTLLNSPSTTIALLNANAVIGLVVKDSNQDGMLDLTTGDKLGVSCALCHAVTDESVLASPNHLGGGSIGREVDGPTPHNLQVGRILAAAANSRAFYPMLQLKLAARGNTSVGRAPSDAGITESSTEAEVDAYLSNAAYYPPGTFDDAPDGVGAPQHIVPFFRTDLAAPFGTPGDIARLENFNNFVYTVLFDPTTLVTPAGRDLLRALAGADAGAEIADDYLAVLTETGVRGPDAGVDGQGFPFVVASDGGMAGAEATPVGLRVDDQRLADLNAYTDSLHAPAPPSGLDAMKVAVGREVFRRGSCTNCHQVDSSRPVPTFIVPLEQMLQGYAPVVLAQRPAEAPFRPMAFAPLQDDPSTIFDDKLVTIEASRRGEVRGIALPLLLDLARKDRFLHDSSVAGLDALLDPARGTNMSRVPHPFFVPDAAERASVVELLKSLHD